MIMRLPLCQKGGSWINSRKIVSCSLFVFICEGNPLSLLIGEEFHKAFKKKTFVGANTTQVSSTLN